MNQPDVKVSRSFSLRTETQDITESSGPWLELDTV